MGHAGENGACALTVDGPSEMPTATPNQTSAAVGLLDDLRRLHKDIALIQQQINVAVRLIELVTEESKLSRRELSVAINIELLHYRADFLLIHQLLDRCNEREVLGHQRGVISLALSLPSGQNLPLIDGALCRPHAKSSEPLQWPAGRCLLLPLPSPSPSHH